MKPTDFLSGIVYFFNDLIGAVVPGIILIAALFVQKNIPEVVVSNFLQFDASIRWLLLIIMAYALGHALLSLHRLLQPYIGNFLRGINSLLIKWKWDSARYESIISNTKTFECFKEIIIKRTKKSLESNEEYKFDYYNLRNMAMTLSNEAGDLARRFMFISLFCYGVSMSILIIGIIDLGYNYSAVGFCLYVIIFFLFYSRGIEFEFRAQNTPFSIVLSEIISEKVKNEDEE